MWYESPMSARWLAKPNPVHSHLFHVNTLFIVKAKTLFIQVPPPNRVGLLNQDGSTNFEHAIQAGFGYWVLGLGFRSPFLNPHMTTHHSDNGCPFKKSNQIRPNHRMRSQGSGYFWAQRTIHPFTTSTGFFMVWPVAILLPLIWAGQYLNFFFQVLANFPFIVMTTGQKLGHS